MEERVLNTIFWLVFFTLLPGLLMASLGYEGPVGFYLFIGLLFGIPLLFHIRRERKRARYWVG